MATQLDQLHYTWASRGVEGSNRFQIAALSAGLRSGPTAAVLPMVERLCRYDPPRGEGSELPVSFGWLDEEGYRIAFRRLGLPPERSTRGNFAGHFLVGPAADLPEADIATLFGSPFWWNGLDPDGIEAEANRERNFELPQLWLGELTVAGPPDDASVRAGQALLYGIFEQPRDSRLAVDATAEELGSAMRAAAQLAPEALRGLSFSTYEREPVFPFDIVGGDGAGSGVVVASLELPADIDELAGLTLDALRDWGDLSGVAMQASGRRRGSGSPSDVWKVARRIVSLCREGTGAGKEALSLLAEPGAMRLACRAEAGRSAVVAAVQAGEPGAIAAIETACAEMDPADVSALADAVVEHYYDSRDLRGCGAFASALGRAFEGALDIALNLALEDEAAVTDLRGEDAAVLVARAAERGMDAAAARSLLHGLRQQVAFCARVSQVPSDYLAAMFELGLDDPGATSRLGDVVRVRPALLTELQLDESQNERCLEALRPLVVSCGPVAAANCVVGLPPRPDGSQAPPALSRACDELAAELLLVRQRSLALKMLELSGSTGAKDAIAVLRNSGGRPRAILDSATRGSGQIQPAVLQEAVVSDAFARAIDAVESFPDVKAIWEALSADHPLEDEMTVLHRLLILAKESGRKTTVVDVLAWIALTREPASPKLISRLGKIRDSEVDELSLELAADIGTSGLPLQNESFKRSDRRSRKWWKRLRKQQRKTFRA